MLIYVFMLNFTINSDLKSLIIPLLKLNVKLINKQRLRIKVQVNGNSLPSTEWLTQKKPAEVEEHMEYGRDGPFNTASEEFPPVSVGGRKSIHNPIII